MRVRIALSSFALIASGMLAAAPMASAADPAIEGQVTTSTGSPLGGVAISATSNGSVVATTVSDGAGAYRFDIPSGTYSLTFTPSTADFSPASAIWVEAPRDWPLDVVMTPPAVGRVFLTGDLALDSGEPLVGGHVLFAGGGNSTGSDGYFSMAHPAGTSGQWGFRGTATVGSTSLFVSATGGPTLKMLQDMHTQLTVPVTTTSVVVRDGNGEPVVGAQVRLNSGGYGKNDSKVAVATGTTPFTMSWTATGRTDAAGAVTLTRPVLQSSVVGTLIVDAPTSAWTSVFTDASIPTIGGSLSATLSAPRITASGRVLMNDGSPVAGATVIPFDPNSRVNGGNSSDGSGRWSVSQTKGFTGIWMISARDVVTPGTSDTLNFSLKGGAARTWNDAFTIDFSVPSTYSAVRVVDAAGAPIAGASVSVAVDDAVRSAQVRLLTGEPIFAGTWSGRAVSGADGIARIPGLVTDNDASVRITVTAPMGSTYESKVTSTTTNALNGFVVMLPSVASVRVSGRVMFSDGTAVPEPVVIPFDATSSVNGGNAGSLQGDFSTVKPSGFVGSWKISGRPQNKLAVPDPLWFQASGGAARTWASDARVDFTIPKTLYRMRVVDTNGAPITNALVQVSVNDASGNAARMTLLPDEPEFTGTWRGRDFTGSDGIAQVPAIVSSNVVNTTVNVSTDTGSRFIARTLTLRSSDLAETVIVLQQLAPRVSSASPMSVSPGDTITVRGSNLAGVTAVRVGAVPLEFTVDSETQVRARVSSDATSGTLTLVAPGGSVQAGSITVTSRELAIATAALPDGMVGSPFSAQLSASGGLAPLRWTRTSGALPTGLTLSSGGSLSGTPTRALSGTFGVTVTDARGTSVVRVITWTIKPKPGTVPGAVSRLTAAPAAGRVSLAWRAPVDDGGNVITGYRVERSLDGVNWTSVADNTGSTSRGYSFAVAPGIAYRYRVAAINAAGVGAFGAEAFAGPVAAYGVAGSPTALSLTRSTATTVTVRWNPPTTEGGTPVTSYRVRTSTDGTTWTTVLSATKSRVVTVPSRAGTPTWVQVSAINLAGLSPYATSGPVQ